MGTESERPRRGRRRERGFTLIELLVVITILGILAAIVVFSVQGTGDKGDTAARSTDASVVRTAEEAHCAQHNAYTDAQGLVDAKLLTAKPTLSTIHLDQVAPGTAGACGGKTYNVTPVPQQTKYPLTITQPDGTTAVLTQPPTRIVTAGLPAYAVEELIALGVKPVGGQTPAANSNDTYAANGLPNEIAGMLGTPGWPTFASTGTQFPAGSSTAIAALSPDLVVSNQAMNGPQLTTASNGGTIPVLSLDQNAAPTGTGIQRLNWYRNLMQLAVVLNKQQAAASFIAAFEAKAAAVIPTLSGKSVSIVNPFVSGSTNQLSAIGPCYNVGLFESYLGLTVTSVPSAGTPLTTANGCGSTLSMEQAGLLNGDYLQVSYVSAQGKPAVDALFDTSNSTAANFQALPSFQANRWLKTDGPSFVNANDPGLWTGTAETGTIVPASSGPIAIQGPIGQINNISALADAFGHTPYTHTP